MSFRGPWVVEFSASLSAVVRIRVDCVLVTGLVFWIVFLFCGLPEVLMRRHWNLFGAQLSPPSKHTFFEMVSRESNSVLVA